MSEGLPTAEALEHLDELLDGMSLSLAEQGEPQTERHRRRWLAPLLAAAAVAALVLVRTPSSESARTPVDVELDVASPRPFVVYPAGDDLTVIWLLDSEQ